MTDLVISSLQKHIDSYVQTHLENFNTVDDGDIKEYEKMYKKDVEDYTEILNYIKSGDIKSAYALYYELDTSARNFPDDIEGYLNEHKKVAKVKKEEKKSKDELIKQQVFECSTDAISHLCPGLSDTISEWVKDFKKSNFSKDEEEICLNKINKKIGKWIKEFYYKSKNNEEDDEEDE